MRYWINAFCLSLFSVSMLCATGCDQSTTEPKTRPVPAAKDDAETGSKIDIDVPGADIEIKKSEDDTTVEADANETN